MRTSRETHVPSLKVILLKFASRFFHLFSTFPNSNQVDEEPLCGCATSKSLYSLNLPYACSVMSHREDVMML